MSAMLGIMRTVIRVFFISVLTMKLLELEISTVSRISNGQILLSFLYIAR